MTQIWPVKVQPGVRVRMRDGVELNVRVTRPDAPEWFPAVMEYHPYRRLAAALPDYRDEYPPVVPYLAERGYAVAQYDVRGTGSSSGFSTDIYALEERRDYAPLMNALNFAPPDPDLVGDRWAAIWAERLERSAPWSLGYIRNMLHGDHWREQSLAPDYDRVRCAVLLIDGW